LRGSLWLNINGQAWPTSQSSLDPRDHMFNTGPDWYWAVGESGLRAVRKALTLADEPAVRRVLDLPSGHGRVGRYLRAGFPDAELFFCDIDAEGAEFCARTFGGTAIASKPALTEAVLPQQCDMIWVGSLFTHRRSRPDRTVAAPSVLGYLLIGLTLAILPKGRLSCSQVPPSGR
jgi:hypothetical protein